MNSTINLRLAKEQKFVLVARNLLNECHQELYATVVSTIRQHLFFLQKKDASDATYTQLQLTSPTEAQFEEQLVQLYHEKDAIIANRLRHDRQVKLELESEIERERERERVNIISTFL